ncbi:gamma-glutamyl-gamma-aminobutyrate hydrolase family protein [Pelagibius sp.]|uniref:gamma-glutamyl-gamma-aminobutyrate hydrolase family protein n=1 Tax=Pelagibius sp. TaxID=1931238 RepID=UPI003B50688B
MATQITRQPLVGITLDSEPAGGWSKFPWYALRQNYTAAVIEAGGLPVLLPHEAAQAEAYLERIDALMITGGAFDVDPALFGDSHRHETVHTKDARTAFEAAVTRGALERDMPVLGICGGQQLLNVVLGGSLIQHIPDEVEAALAHEQPNPRDEAGHDVALTGDSLLRDICRAEVLPVNSAHHQAVKAPGRGLRVNAVAPDGVIEGIEAPDYRFCLGVQWHPEFAITPSDRAIFRAFVAAAA